MNCNELSENPTLSKQFLFHNIILLPEIVSLFDFINYRLLKLLL